MASTNKTNELDRLLRFSSTKSRSIKLIIAKGKKHFASHNSGPDLRLHQQRVVVKSSIRKIKMGEAGSLHTIFKSHIRYIGRDGTGIDGEKPELFTRSDDTALPVQKIENEQRIFKFIVSPEKGSEINLKDYTRDIMNDAEKSLGKKLDWTASCHYNTDNPHIHIVVRGVSEGKQLFIDKEFMFQHFRDIATDRATRELGHRNYFDITEQKSKEIFSERFTSHDRQIKSMIDRNNIVIPSSDYLKSRCEHLERLGLAISYGKNQYKIAENFELVLKENGYRDDIQKRMFHDIPENRKPVFIYKDSMTVSGKVVAKEFENEQIEKPYVFIETNDKLYYLADYGLSKVKIGQDITIEKGKISKDKEIEKGIEK